MDYASKMTESSASGLAPGSPRWFWVASIWLGIGLADATQTIVVMLRSEGMEHARLRVFLVLLLSWLPWALATGFVLSMGRRYPLLPWRRSGYQFAEASRRWRGMIGVVYAAWSMGLEILFNPWGDSTPPRGRLPSFFWPGSRTA